MSTYSTRHTRVHPRTFKGETTYEPNHISTPSGIRDKSFSESMSEMVIDLPPMTLDQARAWLRELEARIEALEVEVDADKEV